MGNDQDKENKQGEDKGKRPMTVADLPPISTSSRSTTAAAPDPVPAPVLGPPAPTSMMNTSGNGVVAAAGSGQGTVGGGGGSGTAPGSGTTSGAKTPRRVQWNQQISITPPTPSTDLSMQNLTFPPRVITRAHHERPALPPALRMPATTSTAGAGVAPDGQQHEAAGEGHATSPTSPTHTLDEGNFEHVRSALERHKSGRGPGGRARRAFHLSLTDQETEEETVDRNGHGHERHESDHDSDDGEEDYDYRLDDGRYRDSYAMSSNNSSTIEMSHLGDQYQEPSVGTYTPGETFGSYRDVHPSAVSADHEHKTPEPEEAPEEQEEVSDVYDRMPVFVDSGETDGLPNMANVQANGESERGLDATDQIHEENQAEASALVKAHKSGRFGGFLRNRKKGLSKGLSTVSGGMIGGSMPQGPMPDEEKGLNAFSQKYMPKDGRYPELGPAFGRKGGHTGANAPLAAGSLAGGGVLASLLALYDNGQQSGNTTPASSRPSSLAASSEDSSDEDERERDRRREKERKRRKEEDRRREKEANRQAKKSAAAANKAKTAAATAHNRLPQHPPSSPQSPTGALGGSLPPSPLLSPSFGQSNRTQSATSLSDMGKRSGKQIMSSVKRVADRVGLDLDDRPKQARSGAGVFGALIANTGQLGAAAAPTASALLPNAKRPGYRLNRFSLGDFEKSPTDSTFNLTLPSPTQRPSSMYAQSEPGADAGGRESPSSSSGTRVDDTIQPVGRAHTTGDMVAAQSGPLNPPPKDKYKSFGAKAFGSATHLPLQSAHAVRSAGYWLKHGGTKSTSGTPPSEYGGSDKGSDYFSEKHTKQSYEDDRKRKEWEKEKKKRKRAKEKKKQQEIFVR